MQINNLTKLKNGGSVSLNLSPWFIPSEPPVRPGVYQIKNHVGHITEAYWDGTHFLHTGLHIRAGLRIGITTIYRWRGVTLP